MHLCGLNISPGVICMTEIAGGIKHRPSHCTPCHTAQSQLWDNKGLFKRVLSLRNTFREFYSIEKDGCEKQIWGFALSRALLRYFPRYSDLSQPPTHPISVVSAPHSSLSTLRALVLWLDQALLACYGHWPIFAVKGKSKMHDGPNTWYCSKLLWWEGSGLGTRDWVP